MSFFKGIPARNNCFEIMFHSLFLDKNRIDVNVDCPVIYKKQVLVDDSELKLSRNNIWTYFNTQIQRRTSAFWKCTYDRYFHARPGLKTGLNIKRGKHSLSEANIHIRALQLLQGEKRIRIKSLIAINFTLKEIKEIIADNETDYSRILEEDVATLLEIVRDFILNHSMLFRTRQ